MANERDTVRPFIAAVLAHCTGLQAVQFFAVVDRASTDGTVAILQELSQADARVTVVWAEASRCVVDAYVRGYQEAIAAQCDWILEIDAGFSHAPTDIPKFLAKMQQGYDCVFGSRFCRGGKISDSSWRRYVISWGGTFLTNLLLGTKLADMTSGFEMFSRRALQAVLDNGIHSRNHFFQTEIRVFCHHFRIAEVPIHYRSASASVNNSVVQEAFKNLWRLTRQRLNGRLWQVDLCAQYSRHPLGATAKLTD
ncbi:MAG: glycosyltransferase [Spirulinaceae cyanobacterium SM2_1_0]|nr:glycosyltransferase [Spirulinaceae cyanobacterium SM2_1_0]